MITLRSTRKLITHFNIPLPPRALEKEYVSPQAEWYATLTQLDGLPVALCMNASTCYVSLIPLSSDKGLRELHGRLMMGILRTMRDLGNQEDFHRGSSRAGWAHKGAKGKLS